MSIQLHSFTSQDSLERGLYSRYRDGWTLQAMTWDGHYFVCVFVRPVASGGVAMTAQAALDAARDAHTEALLRAGSLAETGHTAVAFSHCACDPRAARPVSDTAPNTDGT